MKTPRHNRWLVVRTFQSHPSNRRSNPLPWQLSPKTSCAPSYQVEALNRSFEEKNIQMWESFPENSANRWEGFWLPEV